MNEQNSSCNQSDKEETEKEKTSIASQVLPLCKLYLPYIGIAAGILIALALGLKLASKSSYVFGKIGFYTLYIPLWLVISIAILILLALIAKVVTIIFFGLFLLGMFLIFVADRPVEGLLALGPVGIFALAVLNFIIMTLLLSAIPGIVAGIVAYVVIAKSDPSWAAIIALIAFLAVTAAAFNFIWKFLIPFSLGFSISLAVGKIVAAAVSLIFAGNNIFLPRSTALLAPTRPIRSIRDVGIVFDKLERYWEGVKIFWDKYPVVFIGAVLFGFAFTALWNYGDDDDDD